jgi:hypothetical protein
MRQCCHCRQQVQQEQQHAVVLSAAARGMLLACLCNMR